MFKVICSGAYRFQWWFCLRAAAAALYPIVISQAVTWFSLYILFETILKCQRNASLFRISNGKSHYICSNLFQRFIWLLIIFCDIEMALRKLHLTINLYECESWSDNIPWYQSSNFFYIKLYYNYKSIGKRFYNFYFNFFSRFLLI